MKKFNSQFFKTNLNDDASKIDASIKNMPRLLISPEINKIVVFLNQIRCAYFSLNRLTSILNALNSLDPDPMNVKRLISNFQTLLTANHLLHGLSNVSEQVSKFSLDSEDRLGTWANYGSMIILLDESIELMNLIIRAHQSKLISETVNKNITLVSAGLVGLNVLKNQLENGAEETLKPNSPR